MMNRIREIQDRYALTFIIFWRGSSDEGAIYHEATPSSKRRFGLTIRKLHSEGKLRVFRSNDNPDVYLYRVI